MVSQIPSLLVCVAAGVLITRVAEGEGDKPTSLGHEIAAQLTRNPRAIYLAAGFTLRLRGGAGLPVVRVPAAAAGLVALGRGLAAKLQRNGEGDSGQADQRLQREGPRRRRGVTRPSSTRRAPSALRWP